jgi:hypothetical protein
MPMPDTAEKMAVKVFVPESRHKLGTNDMRSMDSQTDDAQFDRPGTAPPIDTIDEETHRPSTTPDRAFLRHKTTTIVSKKPAPMVVAAPMEAAVLMEDDPEYPEESYYATPEQSAMEDSARESM